MVKKYTNNKGKALGSGTISHARRAKRAEIFGEPWSAPSSNWWQADTEHDRSSSSAGWWWEGQPQEEVDADYKWQAHDAAQQQAGGWLPDDGSGDQAVHRPTSSSRKAPVTPPWKKEESDDEMLVKAEPDNEPHTPWHNLDSVMKEPSSTSSSDDWGKLWHGAKKVRPPSEEILMDNPIFEPASSSTPLKDPEVEVQADRMRMALFPKVMVDWHNCLEVRGQVDEVS